MYTRILLTGQVRSPPRLTTLSITKAHDFVRSHASRTTCVSTISAPTTCIVSAPTTDAIARHMTQTTTTAKVTDTRQGIVVPRWRRELLHIYNNGLVRTLSLKFGKGLYQCTRSVRYSVYILNGCSKGVHPNVRDRPLNSLGNVR